MLFTVYYRPHSLFAVLQVTESAKALLDAGAEIPCDLMAKVIKCQLLQIKANDQQRREAEKASHSDCRSSVGFRNLNLFLFCLFSLRLRGLEQSMMAKTKYRPRSLTRRGRTHPPLWARPKTKGPS